MAEESIQNAGTGSAGQTENAPADEPAEARFSFKQYLLFNALFDAFCIVQLILVQIVLRDTRGLYFFFVLLMAGFFAVSMFDFAYDRLADRGKQPSGE